MSDPVAIKQVQHECDANIHKSGALQQAQWAANKISMESALRGGLFLVTAFLSAKISSRLMP